MSVPYFEKSSVYSSATTTTTNSNNKTPFGIEDILFINNNNGQSLNKNAIVSDNKTGFKSAMKNNEAEEFKKILSSER